MKPLLLSLAIGLIAAATRLAAPPSLPATSAAPSSASSAVELARWKDERLNECSGLAASRRYRDLLWTHNDSGDSARLFLVDGKGQTRATVELDGAQAIDWEDMALSGRGHDVWLYAADIGDNLEARSEIAIYRIREPEINLSSSAAPPTVQVKCERMILRYPDGAHNAETLAVAPDGRLLIVTKTLDRSAFYIVSKFQAGTTQTLSKIGEYAFGATTAHRRVRPRQTTGGDISPDGTRLVVMTYTQLYEWKLPRGNWKGFLKQTPRVEELPALDQAESVCFAADGKHLLVSSEGLHAPLWELSLP